MFYEVLMEKGAEAQERRRAPGKFEEAGESLAAYAPGLIGVPMLGSGLTMLAHPDSNAAGKVAGGALALGGGALLHKGIKGALRVKKKNRELRESIRREREAARYGR